MSPRENTAAASGPLDDFWMTPVMGLRMRFEFAKSVIEMTHAAEEKRRVAEEASAKNTPKKEVLEEPAASKDIKPEISLPPIPPPPRLLRY